LKIAQFSDPRVFCALLKGSLGIGYWRWESKKYNDGATGPTKKFDDIFSRLDTIYQCDGQTPGNSKDCTYA